VSPRIGPPGVPRLLQDEPAGANLGAHLALYGPVEVPRGATQEQDLIAAIEASGLRGRGGAWFPTAIKLKSVRARGGTHHHTPFVVCNAMEGEPVAGGDSWLLANAPHLIIDGIELAMAMTGAHHGAIGLHDDNPAAAQVHAALAARGQDRIEVMHVPGRYVASEESALARAVGGSTPIPTSGVRPFEHGVKGAPTLVQNAESAAQMALIARFGAPWFRSVGSPETPGTALVTIGGAVRGPRVAEAPLGTPTSALLAMAGGPIGSPQAVLTGGYGGTWARMSPLLDAPWEPDAMKALGVAVGAGVLWVHPEDRCGLVETARMADYLARESAGQCGSCAFGLNAVADDLQLLAEARATSDDVERLTRRLSAIPRRGACSLPDGAVRMAQTALVTFADDITAHLQGRCDAGERNPSTPNPIPWAPIPTSGARPTTAPGKKWR
jgi:NADH:ubiquinone oxidoreductase subunit F (NADH-binding)